MAQQEAFGQWKKLMSNAEYKARRAARSPLVKETAPSQGRYNPQLNVQGRFRVVAADLQERRDKNTNQLYGDRLWVQVKVDDPSNTVDHGRSFFLNFDVPLARAGQDGQPISWDRHVSWIKAFLAGFGVDGETAGDESLWPELFGATIDKVFLGTPRMFQRDAYAARKANPKKGVNVGDKVTPYPELYMDAVMEEAAAQQGTPTLNDEEYSDVYEEPAAPPAKPARGTATTGNSGAARGRIPTRG